MTLHRLKYLADMNVLVALMDENHAHHAKAAQWFDHAVHHDWALCPFTGAGFLRLMTNPKIGSLTVEEATRVLESLTGRPGYQFWPIRDDWATLVAPFVERVFGHQQITDAYLLGIAVKEGGILVTLDKAVRYLAGELFAKQVLLLE